MDTHVIRTRIVVVWMECSAAMLSMEYVSVGTTIVQYRTYRTLLTIHPCITITTTVITRTRHFASHVS